MQAENKLQFYVNFDLLGKIRENSRKSIAGIAQEINQPALSVLQNLVYLEHFIIKKYASLLDFFRAMSLMRVDFVVIPKENKEEDLTRFVLTNHSINNAFKLTKGFYIEAVFKDMKAMYSFINKARPLVISMKKHHVVSENRELFVPYPLISKNKKGIVYPEHFFLN